MAIRQKYLLDARMGRRIRKENGVFTHTKFVDNYVINIRLALTPVLASSSSLMSLRICSSAGSVLPRFGA